MECGVAQCAMSIQQQSKDRKAEGEKYGEPDVRYKIEDKDFHVVFDGQKWTVEWF